LGAKDMSELIHYKTAEDLFPLWSKRIKSGSGPINDSRLGNDTHNCIVGEAYKFKGDYRDDRYCWECSVHAVKLINGWPIIYMDKEGTVTNNQKDEWQKFDVAIFAYNDKIHGINQELFDKYKAEFVEHWNEAHNK
jgi:hypothetical protein